MSIFAGFEIDVEGYDDIFEQIKTVTKERVEVPDGTYEAKVTKIVAGVSKSGIPKVSIYFKILVGEYENQMIFYNQNLNPSNPETLSFQLKLLGKTLIDLESGVTLTSKRLVTETDALLAEIFEAIDGKKEYVIESKVNAKGYKELKIKNAFDTEVY